MNGACSRTHAGRRPLRRAGAPRTARVPPLRAGDFYATAAAAGGISVYLLQGVDPSLALLAGVAVTVGVRVGSRRAGLRLPVRRE